MREDLRRNKDKSFLLFTKCYVYTTNTRVPWDKLTLEEMNNSDFRWYCVKWFFISKRVLTEQEVENHVKNCPELQESADELSKRSVDVGCNFVEKSEWYNLYESYPIANEYDLKLLINTIGLRMIHFVD